jgi:uncharacterized membrane protein
MQTFLRKVRESLFDLVEMHFLQERSRRIIFGAIALLLFIWGLFINKKYISSFYYLHVSIYFFSYFFYKIHHINDIVLQICCAVVSFCINILAYFMRFKIVEISYTTREQDLEESTEGREQQQQEREIVETQV